MLQQSPPYLWDIIFPLSPERALNGPIQASIFGWVPVFLWCIIGGIFFGGLQDFGSLFASIRHDGKSVGEIIEDSMGSRAKKLFIIFALLVLILVIASFVNIVAGTFLTVADEAGKTRFRFCDQSYR